MTTTAYDIYGELSGRVTSLTVAAGRYSFQGEAITAIVEDVLKKLQPSRSDRLLEVGCNVGLLLTPISGHVAEATGLDHPTCIRRYRELGVPANVRLEAGAWPERQPEGTFDRILVYDVLQYQQDPSRTRAFVDACLERLRPGGRLLLGDIPNVDRKARFLSSERGRRFHEEWSAQKDRLTDEDRLHYELGGRITVPPPTFINDEFVLDLLLAVRKGGADGFVLPQPAALPYSFTREDVLVCKPA